MTLSNLTDEELYQRFAEDVGDLMYSADDLRYAVNTRDLASISARMKDLCDVVATVSKEYVELVTRGVVVECP